MNRLLLCLLFLMASCHDSSSTGPEEEGSKVAFELDNARKGMVLVKASDSYTILGTNSSNALAKERPAMKALFTYDFSISEHEVTRGEYAAYMSGGPNVAIAIYLLPTRPLAMRFCLPMRVRKAKATTQSIPTMPLHLMNSIMHSSWRTFHFFPKLRGTGCQRKQNGCLWRHKIGIHRNPGTTRIQIISCTLFAKRKKMKPKFVIWPATQWNG